MVSAVIGFGCLIKHVKIQRKKIWKEGLVRKCNSFILKY